MRTIFPIILIIALIIISLVLVIGLSLGIGWLLTLFLPFSLFEATLLSMLASAVILLVWFNLLRSVPSLNYEAEEDEFEPDEIPETLFWQTSANRTWENYLRYLFANAIYESILDSPHTSAAIDEDELQDISIHLAGAALRALKAKSPRVKRLTVTKTVLKQELIKMGHQSPDDIILRVASTAVNAQLMYLQEPLRTVAREGLWAEPAELF